MSRDSTHNTDITVGATSSEIGDSLVGWLRGRDWELFILGLVLCSLAVVPVVSAHAYLVNSTPEDGAQLTDPPEAVTLQFSTKVTSADITVTDLAGNRVDTGSVSRRSDTTFRVPLDTLSSGAYTVEWRIISADGHQLDGSFTFVVSETPATNTAEHTTTKKRETQSPTTQATNRQTQTTSGSGPGFGLTAAAIAGIVGVATLLVFREWNE
jgi:methionine-rich copper-binding protein CopC